MLACPLQRQSSRLVSEKLWQDLKTPLVRILFYLLHVVNRRYLLFLGEYQIYFIECGEKNQYFSRVRSTSENADIFTAQDEIYLVFAEKK